VTTDGTLVILGGKPALRFERHYRHPVERVWRAVTDPHEMASWFPSAVVGERAVGAPLVFDDDAQRAAAREAGEPTRVDGPLIAGAVVAYDPPTVFSFTWGDELLRFELIPHGDGTRLVFTQILSHPSVAARNGAGWHACLGALDILLGVDVPDEDGAAVYDDYITRLGPALGTPSGDGAVTWERATHVPPERVRTVTDDPGEVAAWGGAERAAEAPRWDVEATAGGSLYRLTVEDIGDDAERAAIWHALLVQLDLYLAAGQVIPVDHKRWIDAYRQAL
jgi:uncharacterized protein YndB with AHSA1/START domain